MTHKTALTPAESIILPGTETGADSTAFKQWVGEVAVNGQPVRYDLFAPKDPIEETPILINNGYCAPAIVYDALARAIAAQGRNVVRYHPPRHVALHRAVLHGHLANPLKKHADAAGAVMEDVLQHTDFGQVDELGHSMGTPISLLVATRSPEAVRSIMTTGGAGLDGAGGIVRMSWKSMQLLKREIIDEAHHLEELGEMTALAREVFEHIMLHPFDTLAEGYHVSRTNVVPDLIRLHSVGIRIGAILFGQDSFFDHTKVLDHVGDHFDHVLVIPHAKHIHPQLRPVEHAAEQIEAFAALNATSSTPKAA